MFHQRQLAQNHIFKCYCAKLTILHGLIVFLYGTLVLMTQIFKEVTKPLFEVRSSVAEKACLP